ncbi:hypothetical protein KAFR_0H00640 [Kazachstania africana CBS 2517]|uniref:UspA domain-containing protein n=1 Tax=Kazachstania africana (strain ATCC 22294 / BCRC 22015 / CBS 2517 / CECT 1963 / NBRC 1671 / NRRL Y-8276) TaxID=1071382 RepID=H2AYR7_KAZAF|nr:hypothetical protein KAFR_0H00640 [Kazachstania africana CBS 2517]CCF59473.1 hypothetical protein KAFR_0H00640 [Kazachstania africana CBS 2517]
MPSVTSKVNNFSPNIYKSIKLCMQPTPEDSSDAVSVTSDITYNKPYGPPLKSYPYKSFKPCVSFNTVPERNKEFDTIDKRYETDFQGVQFPSDYTMDEFYDNETETENSQFLLNNRYLLNDMDYVRHGRSHSPPPARRNNYGLLGTHTNNKSLELTKMFKIAENGRIVREDYPSRSTLKNDSLVITKFSPDRKKLWNERQLHLEDKLQNKERSFYFSKLLFDGQPAKKTKSKGIEGDGYTPLTKEQKRKNRILNEHIGFYKPRKILCYISGRKHTWVALDWMVTEFAQSMDHLIVVTRLPPLKTTGVASDSDWAPGYNMFDIKKTLASLELYVENLLHRCNNKAIKLTIEITIGKIRKVLIDMTNIYLPDLIITTTLNMQSYVKWRSKYVSDLLCTVFPIPIIVLPVLLMSEFEYDLQFPSSHQATIEPENKNVDSKIEKLDKILRSSFLSAPKPKSKAPVTSTIAENIQKPKSPVIKISFEDQNRLVPVKSAEAQFTEPNKLKNPFQSRKSTDLDLRRVKSSEVPSRNTESGGLFSFWKKPSKKGSVSPSRRLSLYDEITWDDQNKHPKEKKRTLLGKFTKH